MKKSIASSWPSWGTRWQSALLCALSALILSSCMKAKLIGAHQLVSASGINTLLGVSISPPNGTTSGGTLLQIVGVGFTSGMTVTIGGVPCASVTVLTAESLTCVTGAATAGADSVVLAEGSTSDSSLSFTYLGSVQAVVTRISNGGNVGSTGANGGYHVTAKMTSIGASTYDQGTNSTSGTDVNGNTITYRNGLVGVISYQ